MSDDLTRIDVLKMLLYAPSPSGIRNSPVRGKTRLQKEVFLAQKALQDKGIKRKYGFMPYYYGPFSRQLYFDVNLLRSRGLVEESTYGAGEDGIFREFKLTPKGIQDVERLLRDARWREIYEIVRTVKTKYDGLALAELVDYTHHEFPDYVKKNLR